MSIFRPRKPSQDRPADFGLDGYQCAGCGLWHDDLPLAYHATAPDHWDESAAGSHGNELSSDQCIIGDKQFFVRGMIRLPLVDHEGDFEWGVWVSVSEESFAQMSDHWDLQGREHDEPAFGWLATDLSKYSPGTLDLKTMVHTQPVGYRPLIELEPTQHTLAVQQRDGVTLQWVRDIASATLHDPAP